MSRLLDLVNVLRGLEKVSGNCLKFSYDNIAVLVKNSYLKPVADHVVATFIKQLDEPKPSDNKSNKNKKQPSADQMMKNLPLVMEGMKLYTQVLTGAKFTLPPILKNPLRNQDNFPSETDGSSYRMELDLSVSSLDLLELDITNEAVLHNKLFKRIEIDEEYIPAEEDVRFEKMLMEEVKLKDTAKERRVPATRLSRVISFGSLGVGLGFGVLAEASKRVVGLNKKAETDAKLDGSLVLNEANAERIVSTLCKVRGAALKLGQILSIQDNAILSPALSAIFDRVRESADFMPRWQLDQVMTGDLGPDWESRFQSFDPKPFAAASIGQVHMATLLDGTQVAVKVQYPGVAKSIDSDIRNLMTLLSVVAILPKGLFIENIALHMKLELAQECDYVREAECGGRMKDNLSVYREYYVPTVYPDLCANQVLTTEYISGLTIDRCTELPQATRNYIAESILKLVFRELFLHRYMQTDPNWANFLYNPANNTIGLLDFGATREYSPGFVNTYFKIIDAAANMDKANLLKYSEEIGFLTGYESKLMKDAHVDSVMLLAVPFHNDKEFDFGKQTITHEIQELSGIMLKHRLCPPPPEVYSLHRKLSGLFLLAGKLDARFNCYSIWRDIRHQFKPFPQPDDQPLIAD